MGLKEGILSLIRLFLGAASLHTLLIYSIMITLMSMFSRYLICLIKSLIQKNRSAGQ